GPCTLLLTGRPESLAEARDIATTVLRLDPLPRAEMRGLPLFFCQRGALPPPRAENAQLAHLLWPAGAPPPAIIDTILDRADGVPFVLEQIVLSISESINLGPKSGKTSARPP